MQHSDLPSPDGRWAGLTLAVDRPARPGLRVEVASKRRLLLRQADRVALFAVQRTGGRGVHYARTGLYRSPLPPVDAALARRMRETGADDEWAQRWTHQFVDWLSAAADGPLHTGSWTFAGGMPSWAVSNCWARLPVFDPDRGHLTWFGYGDPDEDARDILPLRKLSPPDAARVKAFRRQFREGVLPPVLLWWVSGLNTLLVIDGHDRIAAALAEGSVPEVVVLAPAVEPVWLSAWGSLQIRAYEGRMTQPVSPAAELGRRLARELSESARILGGSRAWLVPGGADAWDQDAAALVPGWNVVGLEQARRIES